MEPENQPRRPARRVADRQREAKSSVTKGELKTLNLDLVTHAGLEAAAKKRGISARKYAAAAITYFVEAGLDPTQPRVNYLDSVAVKVDESTQDVRKHNASIGNRIVEIMRAWERQLYEQLALIQASHIRHLEAVEENMLRALLQVQTQGLAPMLEYIIDYGLDANIGRQMTERIFLQQTGPNFIVSPQLKQLWNKEHDETDGLRRVEKTRILRELLEKYSATSVRSSPAPTPAPPPQPAAKKPDQSTLPGGKPAQPNPPATR